MTGFIRGLFGGNGQPEAPKGGAYFLSEDEAKTFGDIDYMRSSKVVKRTFARKKGQTEELESVRQISATKKQEMNEYGLPKQAKPTATSTFETSKASESPQFERRQVDTSMDMFRNMAKDLKKR
ncbi:MAG: hypothetical protein F6K42_29080 [Leptolyngbya sp. SIO1D8]|nr:hypothetical protein [Leptolyngbya sp. SIO1D8]